MPFDRQHGGLVERRGKKRAGPVGLVVLKDGVEVDNAELEAELIAMIRAEIGAVATSAIGPCMLPVDADGAPLMNGVLYGVDIRAAAEIEELTDHFEAHTLEKQRRARVVEPNVVLEIAFDPPDGNVSRSFMG